MITSRKFSDSYTNGDKDSKFSIRRALMPVSRMIMQAILQVSIATTFYFSSGSGVNSGIISALFASSCVFTGFIFYITFGQKLTSYDLIGTFFIILCVGLIGIGGATGKSSDDQEIDEGKIFNLIMAIIFGLVTGLCFALSAFNLQIVIKSGFNVD